MNSAAAMTIIIATGIATLVAGFLSYCLDHARRQELQREWQALHDQVATLELRVRRMESGL